MSFRYPEWEDYKWYEWQRTSRLPIGYFDTEPRYLGYVFFAVLIAAIFAASCGFGR